MDSVALPPEEEIYIPTISTVETSTPNSQENPSHAVQLPTIRYTPAALGQPVLASRTIVADTIQGAPLLQGIQYRTTFCTQVQFAHTTFHYPPTPPVEAGEPDKVPQAGEPLAIQHSGLDESGLEKVNPFPSLPTPPDLEAISITDQGIPASSYSPVALSATAESKQAIMSANSSGWQQQALASNPSANFCLMPQQANAMLPYSLARRPTQQLPSTALYYQYPYDKHGSPKRMPPLVKEGSSK